MLPAEAWRSRARCAGQAEIMFDHTRSDEALARCAGCPVAEQCLKATMAAEAGEPYRFGVAGGYGPSDRERMAAGETPVRHRLPRTPSTEFRRQRKCKGCPKRFRQPRAGRTRIWCSPACQWRTTQNRAVLAANAKRRWRGLSDEEKEARREKMRARWASLSPEERAELAARKRNRRASRRPLDDGVLRHTA